MRFLVNHVKPLSGHFADAVDVDGFQHKVFNDRENIRLAVRLTCSGIDNPSFTVFLFAGFEHRQRSRGVHPEIAEGILHRLDVADTAGKVKHMSTVTHQPAHEGQVARVAFNNFDIFPDRFDVEGIGAARWIEVVDDGDSRAELHELDRDVASNEAESAGD